MIFAALTGSLSASWDSIRVRFVPPSIAAWMVSSKTSLTILCGLCGSVGNASNSAAFRSVLQNILSCCYAACVVVGAYECNILIQILVIQRTVKCEDLNALSVFAA